MYSSQIKFSDVTKSSFCPLIGFRSGIKHAQSETGRVQVLFNL